MRETGWTPKVIEGGLSKSLESESVKDIESIRSQLVAKINDELPGLLDEKIEDELLIEQHAERPLDDIRHDIETMDFTIHKSMYILAMYYGVMLKLARQSEKYNN